VPVIRAERSRTHLSETQCWRGFPVARRKLRATFFFPSVFEGHHQRVDFKPFEKWVRESFVQLRAALT
jgi:hypothetical protein